MTTNTTLLNNIKFLKEKTFFLKEAIETVKNELKPLGLDIIEMEDKIFQKAIEKIEGKMKILIEI